MGVSEWTLFLEDVVALSNYTIAQDYRIEVAAEYGGLACIIPAKDYI